MGQVALGFRSLAIKGAVFFVMAALLAWALGGTLWPRAVTVDPYPPVTFDGETWFWRMTVGGREGATVRWTMMHRAAGRDAEPLDDRSWAEPAGPVATADALVYAGRADVGSEVWRMERVAAGSDDGRRAITTIELADRLAIERQLARAQAGLE